MQFKALALVYNLNLAFIHIN